MKYQYCGRVDDVLCIILINIIQFILNSLKIFNVQKYLKLIFLPTVNNKGGFSTLDRIKLVMEFLTMKHQVNFKYFRKSI